MLRFYLYVRELEDESESEEDSSDIDGVMPPEYSDDDDFTVALKVALRAMHSATISYGIKYSCSYNYRAY